MKQAAGEWGEKMQKKSIYKDLCQETEVRNASALGFLVNFQQTCYYTIAS